jgi:hypothetical protein
MWVRRTVHFAMPGLIDPGFSYRFGYRSKTFPTGFTTLPAIATGQRAENFP